MDIRRKLVTNMRMLGASESAVSSRRSWTEKATSWPEFGFLTLRSTNGTKGTVVGNPDVARTPEPEAPGLAADRGGGVNVRIAGAAEVGAGAGFAGVVWAAATLASAEAIPMARAAIKATLPRGLMAPPKTS